ncbi:uncharacterized protein LOC106641364 [Copidosoma floridanum]|uniref:uncharacterized protein LOC106641364 n=1 Tax=Copidosoma floridanum TaxID=29053 RepID=UPI0006C956C5|nr:uncharacterized protein LOC106641364 [Copidosoma floridanum]
MARAQPMPARSSTTPASSGAPEPRHHHHHEGQTVGPGTLLGRVSCFIARLFDRPSAREGSTSFYDDRYHRLFKEGIIAGGGMDESSDEEGRSVASQTSAVAAAELDDGREEQVEQDDEPSSLRIGEIKNFLVWHVGRIVLWEDTKHTFIHLLAFNVIFWSTVLFHLRGITAVCSAAVIFSISSIAVMEPQSDHKKAQFTLKYNRFEKDVEHATKELQLMVEEVNRECPTMFFLLLLILFAFSAFVIPCINPVFLVYVSFTSVFVVPPVFVWFFGYQPSNTEKDGEISEFLPEVTEDSLRVLDRAGETGDSPAPPNSNSANGNSTSDKLDEEELVGLKMPSHDEAEEDSADDLSDDIEIQSFDDTDALSRKNRRIGEEDEDSSSDSSDVDAYDDEEEEEEESEALQDMVRKKATKLDKNSKHLDLDRSDNSSDDDFEIIEIEELKNV